MARYEMFFAARTSGNVWIVADNGNIVATFAEDAQAVAVEHCDALNAAHNEIERFTVVAFAGRWHILHDGKHYQAFDRESRAIDECAYLRRNSGGRSFPVDALFGSTGAYGIDSCPTSYISGVTLTPEDVNESLHARFIVPVTVSERYSGTHTLQYSDLPRNNGIFDTYGNAPAMLRQYFGAYNAVIDPIIAGSARENMSQNWAALFLYHGIVKAAHVVIDNGMLAYLPMHKHDAACADGWTRYGDTLSRFHIRAKIGKGLRAILPVRWISDADIETMVNAIRANDPATLGERIEIVSGEDIIDAYNERNYSDQNTGTLSSSCMRYSRCASFLRIYADNPDRVSLAVLRDMQGDVMARALVWRTDAGTTYMDRVYGTDAVQAAFRVWAQSRGYVTTASPVTLQHAAHDEYPYCDTYMYLTLQADGTGTLSVHNDDATHELHSTSGSAYQIRDVSETCSECGYGGDDVQEVRTGRYEHRYLCADCASSYVCEHCGDNDYNGDSCCMDCARHLCDECGEYSEDSHGDHNAHLCESCSNDFTCETCGTSTYGIPNNRCDACEIIAEYGADVRVELQRIDAERRNMALDTRRAVYTAIQRGQWVLPIAHDVVWADGVHGL